MSFLLWIDAPASHIWESVFHFTTGGNYPRIPAIYIGTGNQLHLSMQDLVFFSTNLLKIRKYMKIEMSQKMVKGKV